MSKGILYCNDNVNASETEAKHLSIICRSKKGLKKSNHELTEFFDHHKTDFNPLLISKSFNHGKEKLFQCCIKRLIDILGAFLGCILLSPIFLLVAILIKLDSKGSVIFKQKRVGLNGKTFEMYKFRTMNVDAELNRPQIMDLNETNIVMFKMKNDPRTTKIGKILRKYSIDEFPQLINVLKGEMSLVGPRPPLIEEVEKYENWHYLRLGVIPGLTGLWQVSGRSDIKDFNKVVELDFNYIKNWSVFLDLILIAKTIPVVILAKGAS